MVRRCLSSKLPEQSELIFGYFPPLPKTKKHLGFIGFVRGCMCLTTCRSIWLMLGAGSKMAHKSRTPEILFSGGLKGGMMMGSKGKARILGFSDGFTARVRARTRSWVLDQESPASNRANNSKVFRWGFVYFQLGASTGNGFPFQFGFNLCLLFGEYQKWWGFLWYSFKPQNGYPHEMITAHGWFSTSYTDSFLSASFICFALAFPVEREYLI